MKAKYLFNYFFLFGLFLLILNDHVLKAAYGNWFTGKLSDVAGLLILPMFLKYLFSISTKRSVLFTIVFFVFWKSPFSQLFIDSFNAVGLYNMGRVVDYTDFIAFLILPLSIYVLDNIERFEIKLPRISFQKIATNSLLALTILTFFATSKDVDVDDFEPKNYLSVCCYTEPKELNIGLGSIYVPTIFTPDGNGINDFFQISADSNILRIDTFLVFNQFFGDTVFSATNITDIIPTNGFDGVVSDTVAATQYSYQIFVTSVDNVKVQVFGEICALPCEMPLNIPVPDSLENCAFPIQYDVINGYDENIDSQEDLNCF